MLIDKKEKYTLITPEENTIGLFYDSFTKILASIKDEHIIIDFSENFNIDLQGILLFLNNANDFRSSGTSFVIISSGINIDAIPDEINVVPTLAEALDILEMDTIERDLMSF